MWTNVFCVEYFIIDRFSIPHWSAEQLQYILDPPTQSASDREIRELQNNMPVKSITIRRLVYK